MTRKAGPRPGLTAWERLRPYRESAQAKLREAERQQQERERVRSEEDGRRLQAEAME